MELLSVLGSNVIYLLAFSAIALAIYYILPKKFRRLFLFILSCIFYFCCDYKMMPVLAATAVWTWYCAKRIEKSKSKSWIFAGCLSLVALLAFFKYNHFFISSVNDLLSIFSLENDSGILKIIMPLGVSYYIFKAISYMVDVYKGKNPAEKNLITYSLYLLFYAEILSGPISRFDSFRKTLDDGMLYSKDNFEKGFYYILKGLFMKAVIANRIANYVTMVFSSPTAYPGIALWIAAFFYSIQLYCDFAGYSFIAVGITRMFGLHYVTNFNRPYFAVNIRDFWDRWHISLSSWLKDYVYIPLGGSRCSKSRKNFNILTVFLVSGLWHGSGLNFVVWGLYHGIINIWTPKLDSKPSGIKKAGMIFLNFCLVTLGWIFFGSPSLQMAMVYIVSMFAKFSLSMTSLQNAVIPFTGDSTSVAFFLTAILFILILAIREYYEGKKGIETEKASSFVWQLFLLVSIILFGNFGVSGFIYANF